MKDIINLFPLSLRNEFESLGASKNINEIRLRANKKVSVYFGLKEVILEYIISIKDLLDILVKISNNSIYAIQSEINEGFVTVKGGHRIGVCGEVVIDNGKIINIKNINSMNIRIAREIFNSSKDILSYVLNKSSINNTLIVSPPCCGKTTILRDLIRNISNSGYNVGLVDERGEIASVYNGIPYLDVGNRTDILSNVPKYIGINMLVRSMSPNVIATDEIGSDKDIESIKSAALSGVSLIFTVHGKSLEDIYMKDNMKKIINLFSNVIILSNSNGVGTIEKIHMIKEE